MALNSIIKLGETQILARLSEGDVTTNEFFYHKKHLVKFNRYNSVLQSEQKKQNLVSFNVEFQKELHFRRIVYYIVEQRHLHGIHMFEVSPLEIMYKELLEYNDIPYSPHVSRFTENLQSAIPELEKRIIEKKVMICFSAKINNIMKDEITHSSFVKSMIKVINPIRKDMSEVNNSFQGTFPPNCQQNSIPIKLLSLCSMLIDGHDPQMKCVSQSALTVSQIVMHEYRKKSNCNPTASRRHLKYRETPVTMYVGLKLYATVRAKTLIQKLFFLGICISYDRCIDICNSIAIRLLEKYQHDGVFVPDSLKREVFSIIAKDNIDLNAKCTKVKQHFHGISMTIMQFPPDEYCGVLGILQEKLYDFGPDHVNRKIELPDDYVNLKELPFGVTSPLFVPVCTYNIEEKMFETDNYDSGKSKEISWLEHINASNVSTCSPWSKFHSNTEFDTSQKTVGIQALMPLINEKVSSLKAQFHCMTIIRNTINFINKNQIPVDVSDQNIKRSRYCLQVSLCAIYNLLKQAHLASNSHLSPIQWLDHMSTTSEMCFYWRIILNFQIHVLLFVRSIREGNFELYLETLYQSLKWFFALDKNIIILDGVQYIGLILRRYI